MTPDRTLSSRTPRGAPTVLRLALAAALLAGCAPGGSEGRLAENELTARSVMAAWEAGDVGRMVEYFLPDATYDDFPNGTTYRGVEEIATYKAEVHAWASDLVINVTEVHPSRDGAVVEWVLYGVQSEPIAGRVDVATDREVLLNGVTILEMEGGRVTRAADYLDTLPLVLQVGGRVELPGGRVLEVDPAGG